MLITKKKKRKKKPRFKSWYREDDLNSVVMHTEQSVVVFLEHYQLVKNVHGNREMRAVFDLYIHISENPKQDG